MSTTLKLVVVGDELSGKTALLIAYTTNTFPAEHVPKGSGTYATDIVVDGKPFILSLLDTSLQPVDYDRLRPLSYPETNIFLVCFSVDRRDSFINVKDKWIPEIKYFCPNTPIVIVACKADLYPSGEHSGHGDFVHRAEGLRMAGKFGASYAETSALTLTGVRECFDQAVKFGLVSPVARPNKKSLFPFTFKTKNKPVPSRSMKPPTRECKCYPFC